MARSLRVVDLFSGWGGFTEGAEQAGQQVVWAANHWQLAVQAHSINHPGVQHVCQDLNQANFCLLPEYDVLVASPACQGHSTASQPKRRTYHDEMRATAWVVPLAVEATMPRAVIIENVPSFRRWGPPGNPDGSLYQHWLDTFRKLGYSVQELIVDATAHGVPQRRKRLFVIAMRDGPGIEYTPPMPGEELPFGPEVQWGAGRWRPVEEARPSRQRVIQRGKERFGGRARFIGQDVSHHRGIPTTEAIRTITTQDQWFVVKGGVYRPLTIRETARAMGFPEHYDWPSESTRGDAIKGLGNAVPPPVARDLILQVAEVLDVPARKAARRKPPRKKKTKKRGKKATRKRATKEVTEPVTRALPQAEQDSFVDLYELAQKIRRGNPLTGTEATKRRLLSF